MIDLLARIDGYVMSQALPRRKNSPHHTSSSIRPELCPAIRAFDRLGIYIGTPYGVNFHGNHNFDVEIYKNALGANLLCPGVIGSPQSDMLYARIDSGLSVVDLRSPLVAISIQNSIHGNSCLRIPPAVYPVSYTGPILIPVGANSAIHVPRGEFLIHLFALSSDGGEFRIVPSSIAHDKFEGLLTREWENSRNDYQASNAVQIMSR